MYKIGQMPKSLELGYIGENLFRTIEIDMSAWVEKLPGGVPSIIHIQPGKTEADAYIADTEFDEETNVLSWTITDADLGTLDSENNGEGDIQIWMEEETVDDSVTKRGKSIHIASIIHRSATAPDTETPAAQTGWMEAMTALKTATVSAAEDAEDAKDDAVTAKEAAEDAQEAAENAQTAAEAAQAQAEAQAQHYPVIIDGYWAFWDQETEQYVKSNQKAQGPQGDPGDPEELIDDTSTGLDKAWSANKSNTLLSALQVLEPAASASDVGKFLKAKTVENGKVTEYEFGEGGSDDPAVIAQKVANWCDENITNPDSPPLDRSLTSSSAAAPADVTGNIKKDVDDILDAIETETTQNLIAIANKKSGYKIDGSGAVVTTSAFDTYEITYDGSYSTFNASLYSNSSYDIKAIAFYNSNNEVISTVGFSDPSTTTPNTFTNQTIPNGTSKIYIANKRQYGDPSATATVKTITIHQIPSGGTEGQFLKKLSNAHYDVGWADMPIDDTAGDGDINKLWSASKISNEISVLDSGIYWESMESMSGIKIGLVATGSIGDNVSISSKSAWQYRKYDLTGIEYVSISTIIYGSSYYGVVFANSSDEILKNVLVKGADQSETITDYIIKTPQNAKYLYINKYSNDADNPPTSKTILSTKDIPEIKNDIEKIKDSTQWHELNGISKDGMRVNADVGNSISENGSSYWRYACFNITGHSYIEVSTIIYGNTYCGIYFTTDADVVVSKLLKKGEDVAETISNYIVKVPLTAKKVYINKYTSTPGNAPSVKGIQTIKEASTMTEMRLLSFNCGQFDYGDGSTTDEQYKANWRQFINRTSFDACLLQDYITTFGELQEEAKDVIFGNTIRSFIGNNSNSENGLRIASRLNTGFMGTIDVGGSSSVWRSKVLKYNIFACGVNIVVYNGHYQPGAGYETDRATQYANVINDAVTNGYEYVIFCGDFNAQAVSEYEPFTDAGYILCNGGYTGNHVTLRDIYADNIIYSSNLMETHFEVLNNLSLNTDHYPIFATLKVKS